MQLGSVTTGSSIYELVNLRAGPATPSNDRPTEVVTAPGRRLYLSLFETRSLGMWHMSTLVVSLGWEAQAPRIRQPNLCRLDVLHRCLRKPTSIEMNQKIPLSNIVPPSATWSAAIKTRIVRGTVFSDPNRASYFIKHSSAVIRKKSKKREKKNHNDSRLAMLDLADLRTLCVPVVVSPSSLFRPSSSDPVVKKGLLDEAICHL